jgi:hypothetical protein
VEDTFKIEIQIKYSMDGCTEIWTAKHLRGSNWWEMVHHFKRCG